MSILESPAPILVVEQGDNDAPYAYTVPASGEVEPSASVATFDGTGASGDFLCALVFRAQSGEVLMRVFPQTTVPAGDVAQVSYAPFPGGLISKTGSGAISEIDSSTLDITNPTGPVVDIELPSSTEGAGATPLAVGSDSQDSFSWVHVSGAALLDYTVPTAPTLVTAGIYAVNVQVNVPGAPVPASVVFARVTLSNTLVSFATGTLVQEGGALGGPAALTLTYVEKFAAGAKLAVQVANDDPASAWTYHLVVNLLKIGD